jgi:rhodanese-related sulfurtransferase
MTSITVNELHDRLKQDMIIRIIDVREPLEFHTFNIGGENIPLGTLLAQVSQLDYDKEAEIIVICQRGLRSETARRVIESHGFRNVKNLSGGLLAWRKGQFATITP